MNGRTRAQTYLWFAQRLSGAVLAVAVVVHLATIVLAVQGGLTAAEIIGRVKGNAAWLVFYLVFVVAVAVHAPIGLRTILKEMTPIPARGIDGVVGLFALALLWIGLRATFGLYGFGSG
jgi:fumarate reductase subunit C